MTGNTLSMIMDFVVLGFLGVTIFYAIRLTNSLNNFRAMRQEFQHIMRQLTNNIEDAQRGVDNLKAVTRDSGQTLQKLINEAKVVARELEGVSKGSSARPSIGSMVRPAIMRDVEEEAFKLLERELLQEDEEDGFSIFDREYEEEPQPDPKESSNLKSRAERDLYEALQKNKTSGGRIV
jgi:hypothetical protein